MMIMLNMNVDWVMFVRMKKENKTEIFVNVWYSLSRVSGGTFTLPSHRTVLDSLPSHGSSYLTHLILLVNSLHRMGTEDNQVSSDRTSIYVLWIGSQANPLPL